MKILEGPAKFEKNRQTSVQIFQLLPTTIFVLRSWGTTLTIKFTSKAVVLHLNAALAGRAVQNIS